MPSELYEKIAGKNYIVEEVIVQHPLLSCINPMSVNTIRIYSVHFKRKTYLTGATLRMGNGAGVTDNYSKGGFAAEVDVEHGLVMSRAVSQKGETAYILPYSKVPIIGIKIPSRDKVKNMVISAHNRVSALGYIGWDVVVLEDGFVTFLEANTCAGVELQQHAGLIGGKNVYAAYL